jgi:hypothetical protein
MDRRNDPSPQTAQPVDAPRPGLATPFAWIGGGLLLTGTTFLVSVIALFQAFASLFR